MKKLLNNLGLKVLSLFLAILLWFYIQGRDISEMSVKYGIIYNNLSENFYIENTSTNEVNVWIKGPNNLLKRYGKNDGKIEINLKNYTEGKHTIDVKEDMLRLTAGLEIVKISPNKITLTIDRYVEKKVKVIPQYSGVRKVIVEPPMVKIKGDRRTIFNTNAIFTEEFDAKGRKTFYVKLLHPSESAKLEIDRVKIIVY